VVWGVGTMTFIVMVMQRTAFGVAGLPATERFSIGASSLSLFVFAQIVAYVAMQIPAGVMVDRWGSRTTGTLACLTAAAGQVMVATIAHVVPAMTGRAVVGDALILMAALAVLPRWFPARHVPLATQLTIIIGQTGQILSALLFVGILERQGWSAAFARRRGVSADPRCCSTTGHISWPSTADPHVP
jgi:MFS family permease